MEGSDFLLFFKKSVRFMIGKLWIYFLTVSPLEIAHEDHYQ